MTKRAAKDKAMSMLSCDIRHEEVGEGMVAAERLADVGEKASRGAGLER